MGVRIYNQNQIDKIKKAGHILYNTLQLIKDNLKEGVSTKRLDDIATEYIINNGGIPSCKGYQGFPGSICASVNEELIHGIPKKNKRLKKGDIVSIDIVVEYEGYNADAARTYYVEDTTDENKRLIKIAKESFYKGIECAKQGFYVSDISKNIEKHVESNGFGVVKEFVGHGVGKNMHEEPEIPNYYTGRRGIKLREGMVLAIEPMISLGSPNILIADDDWTVIMSDGKNSAHYENTVIITDKDPEIATYVK